MSRRFIWIVLILFVAIAVLARILYPGKTATKLPPQICNSELWNHVYEKERLRIIEPCTSAEGKVVSLQRASDGDLHIGLDPEQKSMLNVMNVIHGHRELVVEIICEHSPTRDEAKQACAGFRSQVKIPQIGDHVRVTGSYVTDSDLGWREIHPVTKIEVFH